MRWIEKTQPKGKKLLARERSKTLPPGEGISLRRDYFDKVSPTFRLGFVDDIGLEPVT